MKNMNGKIKKNKKNIYEFLLGKKEKFDTKQ